MGNGGSSEGIESKDLPANTTKCFSKVKFSLKMHPLCVVYRYTKHFAIEAYITNDISILWRLYYKWVQINQINRYMKKIYFISTLLQDTCSTTIRCTWDDLKVNTVNICMKKK